MILASTTHQASHLGKGKAYRGISEIPSLNKSDPINLRDIEASRFKSASVGGGILDDGMEMKMLMTVPRLLPYDVVYTFVPPYR